MNIMKMTGGILLALLLVAPAWAQTPTLTADDRAAIQDLMGRYARALGECRAEDFADLFVPDTGAFASGFRGRMVGRRQLIALVQSERHCTARAGSAAAPPRPGGNGPTVVLEQTSTGVRGVASLGTAEYQDEYTKTPQGWRFASRTVIIAAEKTSGLDAADMLAIQRLGGATLGEHWVPDDNGVPRLLNAGIQIGLSGEHVTGRAYLKDGSYNDEVYEEPSPGQWRVKSSTHVRPE